MINCLIVEDEPLAAELLKSYIERAPDLKLIAWCDSALEAFSILQRQHIDLMFLDIQMPKLTGLELLKTLKNPPQVIFTTAFRDYAVESYDYDVIDYLMKPIEFDRFLKAIGKYYHRQKIQEPAIGPAETNTFEQAYLFFRVDREQVKVFLKDIHFIEGFGDYIKIHTTGNSPLLTYERMAYLEEKLPEDHFIRVHKSFIICIDKMISFSGTEIKLQGKRIPVGRMYKDRLDRLSK
jgi:DNA-binding LytR/AlgR family response regulator